MIFGYTKYLEREIERLNGRITILEDRNQELIFSLVNRTPIAAPKSEKKHVMSKTDRSASCTCGWNVINDDPIKLQEVISAHYRQNVIPGGRKSWAQTRQKLESHGEENGTE